MDIDTPVLRELKRLQAREGKTLGRLVSDLLTEALGRRREPAKAPPVLQWRTTDGAPLVDFADKQALYDILDSEHMAKPSR